MTKALQAAAVFALAFVGSANINPPACVDCEVVAAVECGEGKLPSCPDSNAVMHANAGGPDGGH